MAQHLTRDRSGFDPLRGMRQPARPKHQDEHKSAEKGFRPGDHAAAPNSDAGRLEQALITNPLTGYRPEPIDSGMYSLSC
jgi:hypothetical protein